VPSERCSPSPVVDIKANIAIDSWGSENVADVVARVAWAVLGYSNTEGSRRVPRHRKNIRIVL
jgi:hypothetical protein